MESFIKNLRYVDYLSAIGSLGWAAYTRSWLWLAFALISFALAWYGPSVRINKFAQKYLVGKKKPPSKPRSPVDELFDATAAVSAPDPRPAARNPVRRQLMYFVAPFAGCNDFSTHAARLSRTNHESPK